MRKEAEIRIWATTTDLEGSDYERKRYFVVIEDNGKRIDVELIFGPGKAMAVEPFVPHELNYTIHDFCDHENDECVLSDPESPESQMAWENELYYRDVEAKKEQAS